MRRNILVALSAIFSLPLIAQRDTIDLNYEWQFSRNEQMTDAETINVPHDFQISQPWVAPAADEKADNTDVAANIKSRLSSRGFKEMGKGWYQLKLTPAESLKGRRLLLQFDGILYTADVYLNGERIGGTNYGYVGFEIDVTNKLRLGQENIVTVVADTREPGNSRWYTGGGLYRNVRLVAMPKDLYFERHPLNITTRDNRFVNITAEVAFQGRNKKALLGATITDADGKVVYEGKSEIRRSTPARISESTLPEIEIPNPRLWDTEHPNLYQVKVTLYREDGSKADEVSTRFGIRTIEVLPDKGLLLNGKKVLLKGYANHHSLGALGAAAFPRAIEKRLQLMKQFGINHIRTSHNPYSREFIELCDQYGILVVDELYDKWTRQHTGGRVPFEQLWQYDIPEWIKRDRNSPSVVMWSLGNELQQDPNQPYNDFGVTMYRLMRTLINRYDSTRLVTVAMHPRYRNWETDSLPCDLAMITDVQSYNYRYMYFPGDGRRFPWMKFYQSEASVAAIGQNYFEMDIDKVIGLAYWGAIDYLGESQGWPAKGWAQGVFDITLLPKPKAYYMKSFFKPEEPVVHIAVIDKKGDIMWNGVQTGNDGMSDHWNRVDGQKLQLITYTNGDEVELRLNGKSLGRKKNNLTDAKMRNQIRWNDITYKSGSLEAIAYQNGKVVARHKIETTGKPAALKLEDDNAAWKADGQDLQHIRVTLVDKKGRKIMTADDDVTLTIDGAATLAAVGNGDINSMETANQQHIHLYQGSALVILRSTRQEGTVTLTAKTKNLKNSKKWTLQKGF